MLPHASTPSPGSIPPAPTVDDMLWNAELRYELEPYHDEAIACVNVTSLSLQSENEFLASMLAWERAPILPIYRWFEPELRLPRPEVLSDESLSAILTEIIRKLYDKKIVLDFTDHLSDRELYSLICLDILPSREKCLDVRNHYTHWDCAHAGGDPTVWLTYYASDEDRITWFDTYCLPLPPKYVPNYFREMPQHPF